MPEQTKSRNINCGFDKSSLGKLRSGAVEFSHNGDHFSFEQTAAQAALDSCCDDTCANRFRQDQDIARTSIRIRQHALRRHKAGNGESVNWFRISDCMTAEQYAPRFLDFPGASAKD